MVRRMKRTETKSRPLFVWAIGLHCAELTPQREYHRAPPRGLLSIWQDLLTISAVFMTGIRIISRRGSHLLTLRIGKPGSSANSRAALARCRSVVGTGLFMIA